ncbi:hypothetical protein JOF29_000878 [Kribbella aluminosa]|uniref:DUF5667 domain-containing protein n=1 Tax=Kribbella aluminosa TaxID=416017 RepID=A0ABS4UDU8_9ACTN|nr:hypothetical protein [Kribbella aluminosa]MBP2349795.1 hypothetical protein [Kribbella aluminosa]
MADRFNLDAIEADDALLDLLAAGGETARAAGADDPAVALLAELRLAVEVEDELPVETIDDPESFLARCAALNPITDPLARKVATRGLVFGVAAVAALSVSGVAAAVTGDPLSPYEKVIEKMVDAVRPQTSFPKQDLDGLPVMDRQKIVKVGKDFQAKVRVEHAGSNGTGDNSGNDTPQARGNVTLPPLPLVEKPMVIPLPPEQQKPQDLVTDNGGIKTTPEPSGTKTTTPSDTKTDTPTSEPTGTPTDKPTGTPTDPPSTPTDTTGTPTPTPTDTTTTTPPANVDNGSTGTGGTGTTDPTTAPTGDSGTGQPAAGATDGTGTTGGTGTSGGTGTTTPPAGDTSGTGGTGSTGTGSTGTGTTTPGDGATTVPNVLGDVLDITLGAVPVDVLPTPTGQPPTLDSAQQYFGQSDATAKSAAAGKPAPAKTAKGRAKAKSAAGTKAAKHSSGKVSTGSVRKAYAKGKHSTGDYPEGKHAAIAQTHGSTDETVLLTILGIVNTPLLENK